MDPATASLDSLDSRDAILDRFFEQSKRHFKFSVMLVVRGGAAHGRNVDGLGAPPELVARLTFPLGSPGLLTRASNASEPFVAKPSTEGADALLVGHLGRAMPSVLVVPIAVRDRVVAVLLGEGPPASLEQARAELLPWTHAVGQALERVIARRKAQGAPDSMRDLPRSRPSLPRLPPEPIPIEPLRRDAAKSSRVPWWVFAAVGGLAVLALGVWLALSAIAPPDAGSVAVAGPKLRGWPRAIDLGDLIDQGRRVSGLGAHADLVSIVAETAGGAIDANASVRDPSGAFVRLTFATKDTTAVVRVTKEGMYGPQSEARASGACAGDACAALPAPHCSLADIATASGAASDPATVVYSSGEVGGSRAPVWVVTVAGRGSATLDAATCKPVAHERLLPAAVPLASLPGAPHAVDPLAVLARAKDQSGLDANAELLEIDARGVDPKGTIDFAGEGERRVVYTFADPASAGPQRRWREVTLDSHGMPVTSTEHDRDPLPLRFRGPAPAPRCDFRRVWKLVAERRAGVAHVTYAAGEEGGAWTIGPSDAQRQTYSDRACAAM